MPVSNGQNGLFEFVKITAKSVGASRCVATKRGSVSFSDGRYGRSGDTTMTDESDTDILKKISKLLDEHLAKQQPVRVPTRLLPKPIRVWRRRRSLRRVT
jgi:hypothetical protein